MIGNNHRTPSHLRALQWEDKTVPDIVELPSAVPDWLLRERRRHKLERVTFYASVVLGISGAIALAWVFTTVVAR